MAIKNEKKGIAYRIDKFVSLIKENALSIFFIFNTTIFFYQSGKILLQHGT
jgi:hypothetical protein